MPDFAYSHLFLKSERSAVTGRGVPQAGSPTRPQDARRARRYQTGLNFRWDAPIQVPCNCLRSWQRRRGLQPKFGLKNKVSLLGLFKIDWAVTDLNDVGADVNADDRTRCQAEDGYVRPWGKRGFVRPARSPNEVASCRRWRGRTELRDKGTFAMEGIGPMRVMGQEF